MIKMPRKSILVLLTVAMFGAGSCNTEKDKGINATDHDDVFIMLMAECNLIVSVPGNLLLKKPGIQIKDGLFFIAHCDRKDVDIRCNYFDGLESWAAKSPYGRAELKIQFYDDRVVEFQTINGLEHYMVDVPNNLVSSINVSYLRPESAQETGGLMTKTCAGMYFTPEQYKAYQESKKTEKAPAEDSGG